MVPVNEIGRGESFGMIALQQLTHQSDKNSKRKATVKALTDCTLAVMSKEKYRNVL